MDCGRAGGREVILTGVCKVETSPHVCVCHSPTWVLQGDCRTKLLLLALRLITPFVLVCRKYSGVCCLCVAMPPSGGGIESESSRLEKTFNIIPSYPESHHRAVSLSATSTNTPGTGTPPKPHWGRVSGNMGCLDIPPGECETSDTFPLSLNAICVLLSMPFK